MDRVLEVKDTLREIFPPSVHGGVKGAVWQAYRELKFKTLRRARALYGGEVRRVDAEEIDAIREAKAKRHAAKLATQFNSTIAHLRQTDEEFYQHTIAELERAVSSFGDVDFPLDEG